MTAARWIFQLSFRQLVQRKRVIGLLILTSLPGIILAIAAGSIDPDERLEVYHGLNIGLLLAVGLAVTALLNATAAFGEERQSATISYIVVKPVPRLTIAASVTMAAIAATLLIAGAGIGITWVIAIIAIGEVGMGQAPVLALVVEALGYSAVFVPLGLVFSRATLAGLAYIFIWESILAVVIGTLAPSSVWLTALSAYVDVADSLGFDATEPLGNMQPGAGGAIVKVLAAALASVAVTSWILRNRDLA